MQTGAGGRDAHVSGPVAITVVTPSYNQARFLDETLRSVLSQREDVHEYFVVDGGSTDSSVDIIRRYVERGIDGWESANDRGQAHAIDKGFARASGDIICWLNSDDVFLPGALAKVRRAFSANPGWDVLTGYYVRVDAGTRILSFHRIPGESARWARWGAHHVCQQTCFFRRAAYERAGGLNLDLHCVMDTDLWLRMFDAGLVWGHIPEFLAAFRSHETAKSSRWRHEYAEECKFLVRAHPTYYSSRLKARVGLMTYRVTQLLSGRYVRSVLETKRLEGRKLTDVFGDWDVPA